MEYIIRGLTVVIILIIVRGVIAFLKQPKKVQKGKVHLPRFFVILGTVISAIFLIIAIITAFFDEEPGVPVVFLIFSLLGTIFIVGFVNCRISYDEEGFVAKTLLGIKRKATYDQVTAIEENMHETFIYVGKRRVMVDEFSIGGTEFIKLVKSRYTQLHNGQKLPRKNRTNDIFNGNLTDPRGSLLMLVTSALFFVGFMLFMVCDICIPKNENNTIKQTVSFISCNVEESEVVLKSADDQVYRIRFIDDSFDTRDIKAICNGRTAVTVYSIEYTPEENEKFYSVEAIFHEGTRVLSFEETRRMFRQSSTFFIVLPIVACVFWISFVTLIVAIARKPEKFGKKVVRLFFKKGAIRYY